MGRKNKKGKIKGNNNNGGNDDDDKKSYDGISMSCSTSGRGVDASATTTPSPPPLQPSAQPLTRGLVVASTSKERRASWMDEVLEFAQEQAELNLESFRETSSVLSAIATREGVEADEFINTQIWSKVIDTSLTASVGEADNLARRIDQLTKERGGDGKDEMVMQGLAKDNLQRMFTVFATLNAFKGLVDSPEMMNKSWPTRKESDGIEEKHRFGAEGHCHDDGSINQV